MSDEGELFLTPLANLFSNIEEKLSLMKWERAKGLTVLIRAKMKLTPSDPLFKMFNQTVCKRGNRSNAIRTKWNYTRFWKIRRLGIKSYFFICFHHLSKYVFSLSKSRMSKKAPTHPSQSLIQRFSLNDNPAEFTCSKNVHTKCSPSVHQMCTNCSPSEHQL